MLSKRVYTSSNLLDERNFLGRPPSFLRQLDRLPNLKISWWTLTWLWRQQFTADSQFSTVPSCNRVKSCAFDNWCYKKRADSRISPKALHRNIFCLRLKCKLFTCKFAVLSLARSSMLREESQSRLTTVLSNRQLCFCHKNDYFWWLHDNAF